ncbi:MAG: hypothetical protein Q9227_006055 [Pyrenula ochraceoflavens]
MDQASLALNESIGTTIGLIDMLSRLDELRPWHLVVSHNDLSSGLKNALAAAQSIAKLQSTAYRSLQGPEGSNVNGESTHQQSHSIPNEPDITSLTPVESPTSITNAPSVLRPSTLLPILAGPTDRQEASNLPRATSCDEHSALQSFRNLQTFVSGAVSPGTPESSSPVSSSSETWASAVLIEKEME